jgi:hypothetical protein
MIRYKNIFIQTAALIAIAFCGTGVRADTPKVEAIMAKDKDSKPATTFAPDVPKLYAFFRSNGTKKGDKLRGVWIATDVGDAAPRNTKIDESSLAADEDNFYGAFSLSKPDKGWPPGDYRVEIYDGEQLATTVKFAIETPKADGNSEPESKDDSSGD